MRVKLDENLHTSLAAIVADHGHDVETVADEHLLGADDPSVLTSAIKEGRLVITADRGFGDIRRYPPGSHPGVLVLRLDDQSLPATRVVMTELMRNVALSDLAGCVAVYRNSSLRVRRPKNT